MSELDDFEIDPQRDETLPVGPTSHGGGAWLWIAGGALVVVAAAGVIYWQVFRRAQAPETTPSATPVSVTAEPTLAPSPAIDLPPLDRSDALIRDLARGLSAHAQLALWLTQSDLMRRFVTVVVNIDEGISPRAQLGFLAPQGRFAVRAAGGRIVTDPASYARYDTFVDGVEALDARRCADLYRLLLPLGEAAYAEQGEPHGDLTTAVRSALRHLIQTPESPEPATLKPITRDGQVLYQYADPRLEALSAPQKHLLRLGPRNARRVQAKLRELSEALDGATQAQPSPTP